MKVQVPDSFSLQPDWNRIFPDSDHRWVMGLRQGELAEFFANADSTGAVRAEHLRWLEEDFEKYSALLPEARLALQETVDLARTLGAEIDSGLNEREQIQALAATWEPDVVWMHPDAQGVFRLAGGIVCFPSSWAIREKLGHPMREVHSPVPALNEVLGRQVDTFLARQAPGVVWRRENWSLARDNHLNHHLSRPRRRLDQTITSDEVWVRLEHQLLMKLPISGSVLFGIRLELVPLNAVIADRNSATRFARILSTIPEAAAAYKGFAAARPALIRMLEGELATPATHEKQDSVS